MCPVTVYVFLSKDVLLCHIIHGLNEPPPRFFPVPPFIPPTAHEAARLVSHVWENDIQFTEISLLHRRHHQCGLTAEMDASCPRPPSKHIHPPPRSHFSVKQQLTPNRCSPQQLVIVECSHEIEVTVARGLRDGGKRNVQTVNYMLDSHIPSEASTWDGCHISPILLINLSTHINEMHQSAPFSIISISCFIPAVLFDVVCLHIVHWCCILFAVSSYSTSVPHIMHRISSANISDTVSHVSSSLPIM